MIYTLINIYNSIEIMITFIWFEPYTIYKWVFLLIFVKKMIISYINYFFLIRYKNDILYIIQYYNNTKKNSLSS